jgi:hypothetical protein
VSARRREAGSATTEPRSAQRPRHAGARDAVDARDVACVEGGDLMDHDAIGPQAPPPALDADVDEIAPLESAGAVQASGGAMRRDGMAASGERGHHQTLMPRRRRAHQHQHSRAGLVERAEALRVAMRPRSKFSSAAWERVNARC